jgi:hypothetical protein
MAQGTTFTLPNYTGELFELNPNGARFFSAIGGMNGLRTVSNIQFGITTYDLGSDDSNPDALEGQDAPDTAPVARSGLSNIVEIFHESVNISYSKQASTEKLATDAIDGVNNVVDEKSWQVEQKIKKIARRINYQFLNGTYSFPADNTTARKTRGLLSAITTNVVVADGGTGAPDNLSASYIESLIKKIFDNGGMEYDDTLTIITNTAQKIKLDSIYGQPVQSTTVGGVKLEQIYTPLCELNIMLDKHMPQDTIVISTLSMCKPVGLFVPNKGVFFEEPLAKTGASDKSQLYGEFGLDYGVERFHGKITNLIG